MTPDSVPFLALPATVVAVELMLRLKFREVLTRWAGVMRSSTALMRDTEMDDDEKQKRMAKASLVTLTGTLKLAAIIILALVAFVVTVSLGIDVLRIDTSALDALMRVDLELASLVIAIIYVWVRGRVFG